MKIKWPRPAVRRARADFNAGSWATPSNELKTAADARMRSRLDWLGGYHSAMRDVAAQLASKCKACKDTGYVSRGHGLTKLYCASCDHWDSK